MRRALVVVMVVAFVCIVLVLCFFCLPRKLNLKSGSSCSYRYQYFNTDGDVCFDTVRLSDLDAEEIILILNSNRFRWSLDEESGFTDNYCLEFCDDNNKVTRVLIRYGNHGIISMDNPKYKCELDNTMRTEFYSIISKYHRFDNVLIAG